MTISFIDIIDYIGTFAFAISGLRMAAIKHFDWFGAFVVGLVTAVGGGTMRDLCLDRTPFWMEDGIYLVWTGTAFLFAVLFRKHLFRFNNTFFIFDTIGLGLFVVVGFQKAVDAGCSQWVAIIMGTMTGAAGGVFRDILLAQVPLIFRKEIYAMACVIGGLVYMGCNFLGLGLMTTQLAAAGSVILTRILAMKFDIGLPLLTEYRDGSNSDDSSSSRS